jgi:hypothetical protein
MAVSAVQVPANDPQHDHFFVLFGTAWTVSTNKVG